MRKTALLVEAHAGVTGPAVTLDEGVWVIESHPFISVRYNEDVKVSHEPKQLKIWAPARIWTRIDSGYKGPPIHLDAVQL